MGSGTNYRAGGEHHWEVVRTVGGYKVLRQIKTSLVNNLPTYSETSDFYLKENASGEITQMRVYGRKNKRGVREPVMDVDIGYVKIRTNPEGRHLRRAGWRLPQGLRLRGLAPPVYVCLHAHPRHGGADAGGDGRCD
ncbi:MAG: hypothetical protein LUC86_06740 [Prevotellaceae bacterium]|nr:hypothetical protein [Prevotellaceae bacterium]